MLGRPDPDSVARQWVSKAENDLRAAEHILTIVEECPYDTACFHAQPCVEKYIKAFLVSRSLPFPKSHNIERLIALLPDELKPVFDTINRHAMSEYATTMRYPGMYDPILLREAREAVKAARRVRREIRRMLPASTKTKRRIPRKP